MFQSDIKDGEPGAFLEVVKDNLRADVRYEYLLCRNSEYWQPQVASYRQHISEAELPFDYLHFRVIEYDVPAATCILDLDIPRLQRADSGRASKMRFPKKAAGPTYPWNGRMPGSVVLEPDYRESATRFFLVALAARCPYLRAVLS